MRIGWRLVFASMTAMLASPEASSVARSDVLQLAMQRDGRAVLIKLDSQGRMTPPRDLPADVDTPLGSLWKLFVHAYALQQELPDTPYRCTGCDRDEVYCCDPGQSIGRDEALVRSCGPYFNPSRLGIDQRNWRGFWNANVRDAPAWLLDLTQLAPDTRVPVSELLELLQQFPQAQALRATLLDVVLTQPDPAVVGRLGAQWRIKTWSWHRSDDASQRFGGFAGWRLDGTPVWASAPGTSRRVLATFAAALASLPDATRAPGDDAQSECVEVRMFARYPMERVARSDGAAAIAGPLQGDFLVHFRNGNRIDVRSRGELVLSPPDAEGKLSITARLGREDYVARVLEREAAPEPREAARALAIAIRSYLQQNSVTGSNGCLRIDDSSATQRVSPRPAGEGARAITAWTHDLVLAGASVRYHLDAPAPNRMAWSRAVSQAMSDSRYDEILRDAFPRATLTRWGRSASDCAPAEGADDWLRAQLPRWRPRLDAEIGYAETTDFAVCRLNSGRPHVDRSRRRLFVRALRSAQDRLDLAHEYLHLAFEAHPRGQDEAYVEALARRLLLE